MNKKGATTIDVVIIVASAVGGSMAWAYTTFVSKDTAQVLRESRDREISSMRSDISEIKTDIKEILKRIPKQ